MNPRESEATAGENGKDIFTRNQLWLHVIKSSNHIGPVCDSRPSVLMFLCASLTLVESRCHDAGSAFPEGDFIL